MAEKTFQKMKKYSFISGCHLRSVGEQHLLIVYPPSGSPFALEVNESFAHLFSVAQDCGEFSDWELAVALQKEYGLGEQEAKEEVRQTLLLWKEHGLI